MYKIKPKSIWLIIEFAFESHSESLPDITTTQSFSIDWVIVQNDMFATPHSIGIE
jgi:hypothetical protein